MDTLVLEKHEQRIGCQGVSTLIGTMPAIYVVQRDVYGNFTPGFVTAIGAIEATVTEDGNDKIVPLWYNTASQSYSGFVYFIFTQQVRTYSLIVSVYDSSANLTGRSVQVDFNSMAGDIQVPEFSPDNALPLLDAGSDTIAFCGDTVTLCATVSDSYGRGVATWAWDIGSTGTFDTSADGSVLVHTPAEPDSAFACVARMTDSAGFVAYDTVLIDVAPQGCYWRQAAITTNFSDMARSHACAISDSSTIWLIGGIDNSGASLREVWTSTNGVDWAVLTDTAVFGPIHGQCAALLNDSLWVVSSADGKVWVSPSGWQWTLAAEGQGFAGTVGMGLIEHNGELWLLGGEPADSVSAILDPFSVACTAPVWRSSDGRTWEEDTIRSFRAPTRALSLGDSVYQFMPTASAIALSNGERSFAGSWEQMPDSVSAGGSSPLVYEDMIWLVAGVTQAPSILGHAPSAHYGGRGVWWTAPSDGKRRYHEYGIYSAGYDPLLFAAAVEHKGMLWLIGGEQSGDVTDRVWCTR